MAFFLKREHGEKFEVNGLYFEIHRITNTSVTLRIVSREAFRVRYKEGTNDIAKGGDDQAKQRADQQVKFNRLRPRRDANHTKL